MSVVKLATLRRHLRVLRGMEGRLDPTWGEVRDNHYRLFEATVRSAAAELGDLLTPLDKSYFEERHTAEGHFYSVSAMRMYLATAIGAIESQVDSSKGNVVFTLHGIRTQGAWQRLFSDVAQEAGWVCRLGRWYYGHFSAFKLFLPWQRAAKVAWFNSAYDLELNDTSLQFPEEAHPSIVAHSFGTYILGSALIKYKGLHFNKVLLCGSILPRDYPWDTLLNAGRVQAVRNEFGTADRWTRLARWFIPGTGASGTEGFTTSHNRLEQEEFHLAHSDYFDRRHMRERWLPFLRRSVDLIPAVPVDVEPSRGQRPWGMYGIYGLAIVAFFFAIYLTIR